eukprot:COSAG02_NODE_6096_length_3802_cov_8.071294_4_plen_96_part_00
MSLHGNHTFHLVCADWRALCGWWAQALFMELLGDVPKQVTRSGKYAKDLFDSRGKLRNIRELRYWFAWTDTLCARLLSSRRGRSAYLLSVSFAYS